MDRRVERRLAAILAMDVVGYSGLVGVDEAGTLARVKAHRIEFVEPLVAEYHGRVVKLTGDGALVEFASAVDAVECGVAIQSGMAEREAAEPEERRIRFRIGINIGDIVLEDGDIFGDGVNVATRLEGLAEPGGICLARNVFSQVKNKVAFGFERRGEYRVKNFEEPITVYRVSPDSGSFAKAVGLKRAGTSQWRWSALAAAAVAGALVAAVAVEWWSWNELATAGSPGEASEAGTADAQPALPLPDKPSVAVLPFDNLSDDPKQGRLADCITEDIITDLSRLRDLGVVARHSTFLYKDKLTDVRQIARELGAQYVLEGSLQADDDQMRVTARLVDATSGNHVWSERYDRPVDDLFAVRDEVTRLIATSLGGTHGILTRVGRETARLQAPEPPGSR